MIPFERNKRKGAVAKPQGVGERERQKDKFHLRPADQRRPVRGGRVRSAAMQVSFCRARGIKRRAQSNPSSAPKLCPCLARLSRTKARLGEEGILITFSDSPASLHLHTAIVLDASGSVESRLNFRLLLNSVKEEQPFLLWETKWKWKLCILLHPGEMRGIMESLPHKRFHRVACGGEELRG